MFSTLRIRKDLRIPPLPLFVNVKRDFLIDTNDGLISEWSFVEEIYKEELSITGISTEFSPLLIFMTSFVFTAVIICFPRCLLKTKVIINNIVLTVENIF